MKEEILDFRSFLLVVLVLLSLAGQECFPLYNEKSDTQNLNFIPPTQHEIVKFKLEKSDSNKDFKLTKVVSENI